MAVSVPRSAVGCSVIVAFPGLRLNDDSDLILSSVGQCLMIAFGWAHSGSISGFL